MHPSFGGMVWVKVVAGSLLEGVGGACELFDRWGCGGERVLLCSPVAAFVVGEELRARFGRRVSVSELGCWLPVDRVVVSRLFECPVVRVDSGRPAPVAEATLETTCS